MGTLEMELPVPMMMNVLQILMTAMLMLTVLIFLVPAHALVNLVTLETELHVLKKTNVLQILITAT